MLVVEVWTDCLGEVEGARRCKAPDRRMNPVQGALWPEREGSEGEGDGSEGNSEEEEEERRGVCNI